MNTSLQRTGIFKAVGLKSLLPLVIAALTCAFFMTPALAQHDDDHGRGYNHDHGEHRGHDGWRGDREHRRGYDDHRWHEQRQPYYYAQPVYVPPAVYVAPEPSPGISIFLPIHLRR